MKTRQAQSPLASHQPNAPPPTLVPDDLVVEILSWLPAKSLVKFRCVCKSWKSLISDPDFVKLHLRRSARNPNLLLVLEKYSDDLGSYRSVVPCYVRSLLGNQSPPFNEDHCYQLNDDNGYRCIVGSCNGLICYYQHNRILQLSFYLWNPATNFTSEQLAHLRLLGDIHVYHRLAFGYDSLSDTYKVVAFRFDGKAKKDSQKIEVKIHSFGDYGWRNIDSFPVAPLGSYSFGRMNDGVYFNGTLNWLAMGNNYIWDDTSTIAQGAIVSLDLGMETYTQLLLPRLDEAPQVQPTIGVVQPTIGVLMDCLCFSHDLEKTHFVVWKMKEFGVEKSWTQFIKVSYLDLQIDYYHALSPLCMSENGDVVIMATKRQAILYHWTDNRVEQTKLPDCICWKSTMDYVESLVSPYCD